MSYLSEIKTVENALAALKITPFTPVVIPGLPEKYQKKNNADLLVDIVIEALNNEGLEEPWVPDFTDYSQPKYEIWWERSAGSGWSLSVVDSWNADTSCGSRRVFRTREIARYFAENFLELMQEVL